MEHVSLLVGSLHVRLRGDERLAAFLRHYYDQIVADPPPATPPSIEVTWRDLDGTRVGDGLPTLRFRAHDAPTRRFLTTSLVSRSIAEAWPDAQFFHGNALRDRTTGRLLILNGHSGAGKSTLTRELLSTHRFDFLTEDLLILREGPTLTPFPRRASLRLFDDDRYQRTEWTRLSTAAGREPVDLGDPDVVLMETGAARAASATAAKPRLFLSACDEGARALLATEGIGCEALEERPWGVALALSRLPADAAEFARVVEAMESRGFLVLGLGAGIPDPFRDRTRLDRPAAPVMQALSSGEGLQRFLSHRERFAVPHGGRTASERLFQLAGLLSRARFWRIIPGGTPEETSALVLRTAH